MQISDIIISSVFIALLFSGNRIIKFIADLMQPVPVQYNETYPVRYPGEYEPMFENYASIKENIFDAINEEDMNRIYQRLIIFQSCYEGCEMWMHELYKDYQAKEIEIKSFI